MICLGIAVEPLQGNTYYVVLTYFFLMLLVGRMLKLLFDFGLLPKNTPAGKGRTHVTCLLRHVLCCGGVGPVLRSIAALYSIPTAPQ